jgi:hypothetical protein
MCTTPAERDALLRLARAVREERAAALAMDKALTDEGYRVAAARYNRATRETAAALAAVGEEITPDA